MILLTILLILIVISIVVLSYYFFYSDRITLNEENSIKMKAIDFFGKEDTKIIKFEPKTYKKSEIIDKIRKTLAFPNKVAVNENKNGKIVISFPFMAVKKEDVERIKQMEKRQGQRQENNPNIEVDISIDMFVAKKVIITLSSELAEKLSTEEEYVLNRPSEKKIENAKSNKQLVIFKNLVFS